MENVFCEKMIHQSTCLLVYLSFQFARTISSIGNEVLFLVSSLEYVNSKSCVVHHIYSISFLLSLHAGRKY